MQREIDPNSSASRTRRYEGSAVSFAFCNAGVPPALLTFRPSSERTVSFRAKPRNLSRLAGCFAFVAAALRPAALVFFFFAFRLCPNVCHLRFQESDATRNRPELVRFADETV